MVKHDDNKPLKRATGEQLRALHAAGRRRGIDHEGLREIAGVSSLKQLSVTDAARLIDRLQTDEYRRPHKRREPDRAKARGVIRNATPRQRNYIAVLLSDLGWGGEIGAAWLRERHDIRDLEGGVFSTRVASEAIYQLEQAALKARSTDPRNGFETA